MNVRIFFITISLLIALLMFACEKRQTDIANSNISLATSDIDFTKLKVFINNRRYGPSNGCEMALKTSGGMTCGHKGAVSKLSWSQAKSEDGIPVFKFVRNFPVDSKQSQATTITVKIVKLPIVVFEDDMQIITVKETP